MPAPRRVVLATGNPGKLRELRALLRDLDMEVLPQSDFGVPTAVEDGDSFAANALLKARHAAAHTGLPAIADDSGLCVAALDDRPGIHSARFAGPGASDADNLELLLAEIARRGLHRPAARFHCAMAFVVAADDPAPLLVEADWHGSILDAPRGTNGFGYDPVFLVPAHGCSSAELAPDVKNRISHRAQALAALRREFGTRRGPAGRTVPAGSA